MSDPWERRSNLAHANRPGAPGGVSQWRLVGFLAAQPAQGVPGSCFPTRDSQGRTQYGEVVLWVRIGTALLTLSARRHAAERHFFTGDNVDAASCRVILRAGLGRPRIREYGCGREHVTRRMRVQVSRFQGTRGCNPLSSLDLTHWARPARPQWQCRSRTRGFATPAPH